MNEDRLLLTSCVDFNPKITIFATIVAERKNSAWTEGKLKMDLYNL